MAALNDLPFLTGDNVIGVGADAFLMCPADKMCALIKGIPQDMAKLLVLFDFHNFLTVVVPALFADFVRLLQLVAMRTLNESRCRGLEVCITSIGSLFRLF